MVVNITHATSRVFRRRYRGLIAFGFAYAMLLEERKPGLDDKTIVKLIYVFKNGLPDQ